MSRIVVLAAIVLAGCIVAAAGRAVPAPLPRVTMITDSVGGVFYWSEDARHVLGRGLDFVLETKTCRRLVSVGCPAYGERPASALATIQALGPSLGPVVVVDVGYNDLADGYSDGLDSVMRALIAAGVQHVVWVTLEESRDPWIAINAQIRAASARWPQLAVADWAPVAAKHPEWFDDRVHMNGLGGMGFAQFLRPIVLGACGSPCRFASLAPKAAMLRPTVGTHTIELRWRGNEAAVGYDLETRRGRAWWETVVSDRPVTSYRLSGTPGSRIKVRVRARDWDAVPGAWTRPESLRFRSPSLAVAGIPLSAEMTRQLAELKLRSRYSAEEDPVFAAPNGKPLAHRNATRRGFEAAAEKAAIEGVSFHSMRHAFASRMIDRGISSTVLAALMGHESSTITERRYIHLFDRQRTDEAVRQAMASAAR